MLYAGVTGHEAFNCAGPDNALGRSLRELMETYFGAVPEACTVEDDAAAYDVSKATEELGWEPTRS